MIVWTILNDFLTFQSEFQLPSNSQPPCQYPTTPGLPLLCLLPAAPVLDDSIGEVEAELSEERLGRLSFPNTDFLHSAGGQTRIPHLSGELPTTKLLLPQTTDLPDRPCNTAQPVFECLILLPSPEGYSPPYLVF